MRILGFAKDWDKLKQDEFTTFRFEHRGKPYFVGELFQIKIKPRSKGGGVQKGIAELIDKEARLVAFLSEEEAIADGFSSTAEMERWMQKSYGHDERWVFRKPMNKMTLRWV